MTPEQAQTSLFDLIYSSTQMGTSKLLEEIKQFAAAGADVNKSSSGWPLEGAAMYGNHECVDALIEAGADVNAQDGGGHTALHGACIIGNIGAINALIKGGADVNIRTNLGVTVLHYAARKGCVEAIEMLIAQGIDLNSQDSDKQTPLHEAAMNRHPEAIKALLANKAGPNISNKNGQTPLHEAAIRDSIDAIDALIKGGAELNIRDINGHTPLYVAAAYNGQAEVVKALVAAGADLNAQDNHEGYTPLHMAVRSGSLEVVKELVAAGADINFSNNHGKLPLAYAGTNIEIAKVLIMNGADTTHAPDACLAVPEIQLTIQVRAFVNSLINGTQLPALDRSISEMLQYLVRPAELAKVKQVALSFQKDAEMSIAGALYAAKKIPHPMPDCLFTDEEMESDPAYFKLTEFFQQNPQYSTMNFMSTMSTAVGVEALFEDPLVNPKHLQSALRVLLRLYVENIAFLPAGTTCEQLYQSADRISKIIRDKMRPIETVKKHCPLVQIISADDIMPIIRKLEKVPTQKLSALNDMLSLIEPHDRPALLREHITEIAGTLSKLTERDLRSFASSVPHLKAEERKARVLELVKSKNPIAFVKTITEQSAKASSCAQAERNNTLRNRGSTSLGR